MIDDNVTFSSEALYNAEAIVLNNVVDVQFLSGSLLDVYGLIRLDE